MEARAGLEEKREAAERSALLGALGFLAPALFLATGGQGAVIGFFAAPAEFSVTFAVCHCLSSLPLRIRARE